MNDWIIECTADGISVWMTSAHNNTRRPMSLENGLKIMANVRPSVHIRYRLRNVKTEESIPEEIFS